MPQSFENITTILNGWLQEQLSQNKEIELSKKDHFQINGRLLRLEHWLIEWQKDQKINQRINAAIYSENILKQVGNTSSGSAYTELSYQLNFLHYLAIHYHAKRELHNYIDSFVEDYKEQLSLADIVITDTGATRAKTNIRFALNALRRAGLIQSKDLGGKRSLSPSIPGMAVLLVGHFEKKNLMNEVEFYKSPEKLNPLYNKWSPGKFELDPTLSHCSYLFTKNGFFYTFLDQLWSNSISKADRSLFENIMNRYIDFTQEGLEIRPDRVLFTKRFKDLSTAFQKELFEQSKENSDLLSRLIQHYKGLKK